MPSSTAKPIVASSAMNWKVSDPPAPRFSEFSQDSTSSEMNTGKPVNFRQKSMIETARNIR